jgi:hypothetical protein
MIFSKKNAGKWVARKGDKPVAAAKALPDLLKKVEKRKDKKEIRFDLIPPHSYFAGSCGVSVS